jgi:hypothetical protein
MCDELRNDVPLGGCVLFIFFDLLVSDIFLCCIPGMLFVHIVSVVSSLVKLLVVSCLEFRPS